jgi:hypothetical protein
MLFLSIWVLCGIIAVTATGYYFYTKEGKITIGEIPPALLIFMFGPIALFLLGVMALGDLYEKYENVVLLSKEEEE